MHHDSDLRAARFVSDTPPESLVDRLAAVYLESRGDLRRVMAALAESPEFWSPEARRQKIKSPFELAASARERRLAIVHEVGSPDPTRSHFDAHDYMETGTPGRKGTADGWLNRVAGLAGGGRGLRGPLLDLDV